MRIYRCCLGYLTWHILLQIGSYVIYGANYFFVNFVMQKVYFRSSSIVNFTVAWEHVLQNRSILCKGSYSSSIFLGRSQVPIGILLVNRISLRISRQRISSTWAAAVHKPSSTAEPQNLHWGLALQMGTSPCKLIFDPCMQLSPLQSIKLRERPAIQFCDQMHSNDSNTKYPCASSLSSQDTERPRVCPRAMHWLGSS